MEYRNKILDPYVSYSVTVREPVVTLTRQQAHGVSPQFCQLTLEASMFLLRKSEMMKLRGAAGEDGLDGKMDIC